MGWITDCASISFKNPKNIGTKGHDGDFSSQENNLKKFIGSTKIKGKFQCFGRFTFLKYLDSEHFELDNKKNWALLPRAQIVIHILYVGPSNLPCSLKIALDNLDQVIKTLYFLLSA